MSSEVVSTKNGQIRGKVIKVNAEDAKPVHVFRRIPFAKPPLGKLRFMAPQPAERWDGIKDGTILGNMPMHSSNFEEIMNKALPFPRPEGQRVFDEDCLHLSVYSPIHVKDKNLPVMVWFYGGGFALGSEVSYDLSVVAAMNDVVVVVPNYRVGIFGFFSLGKDSPCPGNAGLLDQQLALRWVQENIEAFGGDKDNVTIFGESAGGISVHLQVTSPLSSGLFHKAISHSGQVSMAMLFNDGNANRRVVEFTKKHFKILETDDQKLLDAFQNIPALELTTIQAEHEKHKIQFNPTLDGIVFKKTPKQHVVDKDFHKVPYILGHNSTEGAGIFGLFISPDFEKGITEEASRTMIPFYLSDEGWEKCKKFYEVDKMGEDRYSRMVADVFADGSFVAPAAHDADAHAATGADVYRYVGDFQLKMFHDPAYGKEVVKKPSWCICDHGDDICITLGQPFSLYPLPCDAKFTKEEAELSRKWMTYITNFAKTGDPNKGKAVETQWPKYNTTGEHLVVNHKMSTGKGFRKEAVKFWIETMQSHVTLFQDKLGIDA